MHKAGLPDHDYNGGDDGGDNDDDDDDDYDDDDDTMTTPVLKHLGTFLHCLQRDQGQFPPLKICLKKLFPSKENLIKNCQRKGKKKNGDFSTPSVKTIHLPIIGKSELDFFHFSFLCTFTKV